MKERLITITLVILLTAGIGLIIILHISTTRAWLLDQRLRDEGVETTVEPIRKTAISSAKAPAFPSSSPRHAAPSSWTSAAFSLLACW